MSATIEIHPGQQPYAVALEPWCARVQEPQSANRPNPKMAKGARRLSELGLTGRENPRAAVFPRPLHKCRYG
jgi:hypothetical protein